MTSMEAMTATTLTLTDFLLARIAELEGMLERTTSDEDGLLWLGHKGPKIGLGRRRLLAECEAKRRIVNLMGYVRESWENKHSGVGRVMWPDVNRREKSHALTILENLALPYADHPDYRPEWRP